MVDFTTMNALTRMKPMESMTPMGEDPKKKTYAVDANEASFLDIFKGMVDNVVETNEQVDRDAIDLMLGNIDDLAQVQSNITKAGSEERGAQRLQYDHQHAGLMTSKLPARQHKTSEDVLINE